jgi:hypothetical protein
MLETASPTRRFHVSIVELIGLVALAALACAWPALIPTEIVVVLFWIAARGGSEPATVRLVSLGVVLAAIYLPPLIGFVLAPVLNPSIDGAQWREAWSPYFPYVPGSVPVFLFGILTGLFRQLDKIRPGLELIVECVLASLVTAAEVGGLTFIAGRSQGRRTIAAALGFLLAALGTWLISLLLSAFGAT